VLQERRFGAELMPPIIACERGEALIELLAQSNASTTPAGLPAPGSNFTWNVSLIEPDENEWQLMWDRYVGNSCASVSLLFHLQLVLFRRQVHSYL
jgi:hypothetical protein